MSSLNRIRRTGILGALSLGMLASLVACAATPADERVGESAQAITNGVNDDASPEANIVVSLERPGTNWAACSGTLLTPTLVVTSRGCVDPAKAGPRPVVRVGPNRATAATYSMRAACPPPVDGAPKCYDHAIVMPGAEAGGLSAKGELALIFLDPDRPVLQGVAISHQLLTQPNGLPGPTDDTQAFSTFGVAGWSAFGPTGTPRTNADLRQSFAYPDIHLSTHQGAGDADQPYWVRNASDGRGRLTEGDLGGPLFQTVGKDRQIVGVASKLGANAQTTTACPPGATSCDVWNDVTSGDAVEWIRDNARIAKTAKNARWFDTHPRSATRPDGTPDWWVGEVDYTGECQKAKDDDCDFWYDKNDIDGSKRDNCPVANADQADWDDDGIGDACSPYRPNGDDLTFLQQADRCADIPYAKFSEGVVQMWACNNTWGATGFHLMASGQIKIANRCLTTPGFHVGARVALGTCDGRATQVFKTNVDGTIRSGAFCLENSNNAMVLNRCDGTPGQAFKLPKAPNPAFGATRPSGDDPSTIVSEGKFLQTYVDFNTGVTHIQMHADRSMFTSWNWHLTAKGEIKAMTNAYYWMYGEVPKETGLCLDVPWANEKVGVQVGITGCNGNTWNGQGFAIDPSGLIRYGSLCLERSDTALKLAKCDDTRPTQLFTIAKTVN